MKNLLFVAFVLCVLIFVSVIAADNNDAAEGTVSTKPKTEGKKQKDWNKINVHDLDKEWEQGDESDELEDDMERNRRIQASKQPKLDMSDGEAIQKAYKADPFAFTGGGGQMVFVDLTNKQPNGKPWNKADIDVLAKKFATLLKSGSIPANVYNIDTGRMLVHIDKPWQLKDMLSFLASQREVKAFTANSKTYTSKQWKAQFGTVDDDDDDDDDDL